MMFLSRGLLVLLATFTAFPVLAMKLSPEDHRAILDTVHTVAWAADHKDWATAEAQFVEWPFIDYSSLSGQPGAAVEASELVAGWAAFLGEHVVSQHLVTGHQLRVEGETVVVTSNVMAWHAPAAAPHGPAWTVYGTYDQRLQSIDGAWKVIAMTLHLLRQTGDPALLVNTG